MLLLLARHADAGIPDQSRWPGDADRPLTEYGRATQRKMSELLRNAKLCPTELVSSPLLRARQTAEILAEVCEIAQPPLISAALAAPPDLKAISADLSALPGAAVIALTGHSPWLDELASLLLAGTSNALRIQFSKSAIMVIRAESVTPGAGELVLFLQPVVADAEE